MLRNPYIAGLERFEVPLVRGVQAAAPARRKEQAAIFCLRLWEQFQSDLRAIRYTISFDPTDDQTLEFSQQPHYDAMIGFDASSANQIDIECICRQAAPTPRDLFSHARQEEEHYPVSLEVFIPLSPNHPQAGEVSLPSFAERPLVVWCRPSLLSEITALWERASLLVFDPTS